MPQEYVIVLADPTRMPGDYVLFVEKDRGGPYLAGRYNLPGGKIEEGETPAQAALRELKEETGFEAALPHAVQVMGRVTGEWGTVHCVYVPVVWGEPRPQPGETERFFWAAWHEIAGHSKLMPNLNVIVPLMRGHVSEWTITDNDSSLGKEEHTISVNLRLK